MGQQLPEFDRNTPLIGKINTQLEESHPVISPDGRFLYFTYRFHPQNKGGKRNPGDIWVSEWDELHGWLAPQHTGDLWNNTGFNSIQSFFADGQKVLLTQHDPAGRTSLAVSQYEKEKGWSHPEPLLIQSFYNRSGHLSATISNNAEVLILAMESFGSIGYEDLYISHKQNDGTYSKPQALSKSINSIGQDISPFLYQDTWLFFSSNRPGGHGGKDIYVTKRQGNNWEQWSAAANLGSTVNSPGTEASIFIHPEFHLALVAGTSMTQGNTDLQQLEILGRAPLPFDKSLVSIYGIPQAAEEAALITEPAVLLVQSDASSRLAEDSLESIVKTEQEPPLKTEIAAVMEEKEVAALIEENEAVTIAELITVESLTETNAENMREERIDTSIPTLSTNRYSSRLLAPGFSTTLQAGRWSSPQFRAEPETKMEQVILQISTSDGSKSPMTAIKGIAGINNAQIDEYGRYFYYRKRTEKESITLTAVGFESLTWIPDTGENQVQLTKMEGMQELMRLSAPIAFATLIKPAQAPAISSISRQPSMQLLAMSIVDAESKEPISALVNLPQLFKSESLRADAKGQLDLAIESMMKPMEIMISAPGYQALSLDISNPGMYSFELQSLGIKPLVAQTLKADQKERPLMTKSALNAISLEDQTSLYSLSLVAADAALIGQSQIQNTLGTSDKSWNQENQIWLSLQRPNRLKIIASGYFPQWVEASEWDYTNHIEKQLEPIRAGENFVLSRLAFEQGTINFSDSTVIEELDRLVDMMSNTAGLEIQLTGYTDNQGLVRDNMALSLERADAVKNYIVAKGISPNRITTQGLGPANPIANNANPETRALNRRVECTIIKVVD